MREITARAICYCDQGYGCMGECLEDSPEEVKPAEETSLKITLEINSIFHRIEFDDKLGFERKLEFVIMCALEDMHTASWTAGEANGWVLGYLAGRKSA